MGAEAGGGRSCRGFHFTVNTDNVLNKKYRHHNKFVGDSQHQRPEDHKAEPVQEGALFKRCAEVAVVFDLAEQQQKSHEYARACQEHEHKLCQSLNIKCFEVEKVVQKLQKFVAELAVIPFGHDLDVKNDRCCDRQKYPDDYQSIIDNTYFPYKDAVPIFVTAFGDIITLESGEYISIMYLRYGKCELMLKDFDFFLKRLAYKSFLNEFFL